MSWDTILVEIHEPIAWVTLNRPQVRNAMNAAMVVELTELFDTFRGNRDIRAIVIQGAEGIFCAGGDITEMRNVMSTQTSRQSNSVYLNTMLQTINTADQVVIAKVQGAALGGGFGLVCVADIAVTDENAVFGLPEVRLGVAPSVISPFVIQRIGLTHTRELALTGQQFNGTVAQSYGLVNRAVASDQLDNTVHTYLQAIQKSEPHALATTKEILFAVNGKPVEETVAFRAEMLDKLRASAEAQEGFQAFLEKRKPTWMVNDDS